jgi:hypothetical protein
MEDRKTYLKFCITADAFQLEELLRGLRGDAEALQDRIDEVELFLAHRPDLQVKEPPAEPRRIKRESALVDAELEDMKHKVMFHIQAAVEEERVKIHAGLNINHGLTVATLDQWSKEDAQNAMAVIRALEGKALADLNKEECPF